MKPSSIAGPAVCNRARRGSTTATRVTSAIVGQPGFGAACPAPATASGVIGAVRASSGSGGDVVAGDAGSVTKLSFAPHAGRFEPGFLGWNASVGARRHGGAGGGRALTPPRGRVAHTRGRADTAAPIGERAGSV